MRNPFVSCPEIVKAVDGGELIEALVMVPLGDIRVFARVIVPHVDRWPFHAEIAAAVTVQAVRNRLLAQMEGDPE